MYAFLMHSQCTPLSYWVHKKTTPDHSPLLWWQHPMLFALASILTGLKYSVQSIYCIHLSHVSPSLLLATCVFLCIISCNFEPYFFFVPFVLSGSLLITHLPGFILSLSRTKAVLLAFCFDFIFSALRSVLCVFCYQPCLCTE